MSAEESKEGRIVDPSSTGTVRSLTGRAMSRRQALGLAGGVLAGVATLASTPKVAGAAVESGSDVPTVLPYYGQGTFGRLFPRLPAFATDSPEVRSRLLELGKRGGLMDAGDAPPPANPLAFNPDHTAGVTFLGQFLDHQLSITRRISS